MERYQLMAVQVRRELGRKKRVFCDKKSRYQEETEGERRCQRGRGGVPERRKCRGEELACSHSDQANHQRRRRKDLHTLPRKEKRRRE